MAEFWRPFPRRLVKYPSDPKPKTLEKKSVEVACAREEEASVKRNVVVAFREVRFKSVEVELAPAKSWFEMKKLVVVA